MGLIEQPSSKRLLLIVTIVSIFATFYMMSDALSPKLDLPQDIIAHVSVVEGSGVHDWKQLSLRNRFWLERASHEISALTPYLRDIGPFGHPIELEIDAVNPLRFDVSVDKLVMGTDILRSRGQLQRSLMKVWVLQNADPRAIPSALRYEVAADLLSAFYSGSLNLEDPITHQRIEFPHALNEWTDLLLPLNRFCKTAWRPLELLSLCQMSSQIDSQLNRAETPALMATPMMARPLIGALVWESYQSLSLRQRPDFIRAFADAIKSANAASPMAVEAALPHLPAQWRLFIEREARLLTPVETAPASRLPDIGRLTIEHHGSAWMFVPSGLGLTEADAATLSVKSLIWQSCEQPSVTQLLAAAPSARRVLYVHLCSAAVIDYAILEKDGIEAFASKNLQLSFVSLHQDSLRLAKQKGLTDQLDLIGSVLNFDHRKSSQVAELYLGLARPQWRREIGAYQVDGAIQAIEWFRPQKL